MVIFIYGASAIGKTTFLRNHQYILQPPTGMNLVMVYADHCEEHHLVGIRDFMVVKESKKWGGKRKEKRPMFHLDTMIGDDGTMWVVECMRYLNGLWPELIQAHKLNGGGLRIIVPWYTGETGQYFRQERCDKIGKSLSEYWLDAKNCFSESDYRVRSCEKHLVPVGIPCEFVEIGKSRANWQQIWLLMQRWLGESVEEWYNGLR